LVGCSGVPGCPAEQEADCERPCPLADPVGRAPHAVASWQQWQLGCYSPGARICTGAGGPDSLGPPVQPSRGRAGRGRPTAGHKTWATNVFATPCLRRLGPPRGRSSSPGPRAPEGEACAWHPGHPPPAAARAGSPGRVGSRGQPLQAQRRRQARVLTLARCRQASNWGARWEGSAIPGLRLRT
jgi:hypothetical protein